MRTYLDCYPCFLRQGLEAARMAGADEQEQHRLLIRLMHELTTLEEGCTPPEIGHRIHRMVRRETNADDPYRHLKDMSTDRALALYPRLQRAVRLAQDPLRCAVRLAIAGNIIDFAQAETRSRLDKLWESVETVLEQPFAIDDYRILGKMLRTGGEVLFLADNAGETVFDRVLIETANVTTRYAVKGGPILNDATARDAQQAGIHDVAEIISNGSNGPGTILDDCSPDFLMTLEGAPLIIAKGQANYETLSEYRGPIFFLLKVKCPVIARDIGVPVGSIVCKQGDRFTEIDT